MRHAGLHLEFCVASNALSGRGVGCEGLRRTAVWHNVAAREERECFDRWCLVEEEPNLGFSDFESWW
jgi:hypothetical protein